MIGIMDWGIGGFSVYRSLRARGSTADVLYFSDAGTVPYGRLSKGSLRERFREIAQFFAARGIGEVLVACHSASSALEPGFESGTESFAGVAFRSIIPAAVRAVERSRAGRLGVTGGQLTIQSGVYERALAGLGRRLEFCAAQPLSALVERGELDSPAMEAEVRRVLGQFHEIDALLLACTHYPAAAPLLRKVSPHLELLDPAAEMVQAIKEAGSNHLEYFTTGERDHSIRAARLAFGIEIET